MAFDANQFYVSSSTETIAWGGTRALYAGGTTGNDNTAAGDTASIDYFANIDGADANASDFGDLSAVRISLGSTGSTARAVFCGGNPSYVNIMQYVTTATTGNSTDFGDMTRGRAGSGGVSNGTRGVVALGGGSGISYSTDIDYITIASVGNGTDFGNLDQARGAPAGSSSSVRGLFWAGNINATPSHNDTIQYITIASTGNTTDFGDMSRIVTEHCAGGNENRNMMAGGHYGSLQDTIEYVNPATTGNVTDFGNMIAATYMVQGTASATRFAILGGYGPVAYVASLTYVTIATTGNASAFGDMTVGRYSGTAWSGN
jgi:hypothetical protein